MRFVLLGKNYIFVETIIQMKKIVAFILLAGFVSACSQYTCPTYTKKDAPKVEKKSAQQHI